MTKWDAIIVFPMRSGGEIKAQRRFNKNKFITSMLGLRVVRNTEGKDEEFLDEARRFLRSDRCFMSDDGRQNEVLKELEEKIKNAENDDDEKVELHKQKVEEMKRVMHNEYVKFTGSDEPCPQEVYCELVLRTIVRRLQMTCGLTAKMKYGVKGDQVIVAVNADSNDLKTQADRIDYRLQTHNFPFGADLEKGDRADPDKVQYDSYISHFDAADFNKTFKNEHPTEYAKAREMCYERCDESVYPVVDPGLWRHNWHVTMKKYLDQQGHVEYVKNCKDINEYIYISAYMDYRKEPQFQPFFRHYTLPSGEVSEFRQVDRIRLVTKLVARHINLSSMKDTGNIRDYFAVHDMKKLQDMNRDWVMNPRVHCFGKPTPLLAIRDYFGEKIALYFAWLDFYTYQLAFPTIAGVAAFVIDVMGLESVTPISTTFFACFMCIWATMQSELWKRKNAFINLWWGTTDLEATETDQRSTFVGTLRYNPVTDNKEMHHTNKNLLYRRILSSLIVIGMLVLIFVLATAACFWLKYLMVAGDDPPAYGPIVAGVANAGVISTGNEVALVLAKLLANHENHRTQREYEAQYNLYTFLFRFCVSYASFIYIAFMKRSFEGKCMGDPPFGDCMGELSTQLGSIFITGFVVQNGYEALKPLLMSKMRQILGNVNSADESRMEQIEREVLYEPYEEKESMKDYAELVVQYGFVTLFVAAFPLVPLLALFNNIFESHIDGYKLTHKTRRPTPYQASNIGLWADFMQIQSNICVVTNIGLICFTSGYFDEYSALTRWQIFIVAEHILFIVKGLIDSIVPDMPRRIKNLNDRHHFMGNRLFNGLTITDDDHLEEEAEKVDLRIHPNTYVIDSGAESSIKFAQQDIKKRGGRGADAKIVV